MSPFMRFIVWYNNLRYKAVTIEDGKRTVYRGKAARKQMRQFLQQIENGEVKVTNIKREE